ncbi:MAG: hypothetical protein K9H64_18465 [Bacteroidales bacterium]|nr:hypothetical protein [Bacteroidales bacterium]MCF8458012.1 hypothetical protein [Bacteroidales bacterium]
MRYLIPIFLSFFLLSGCTEVKENKDQRIIDELQNSTSKNVLVVAHRGDWRHAPENSLTAIRNCIALGVDIVEVDVWKTWKVCGMAPSKE